MLSEAFSWTELPSRAAGAQEDGAVGRRVFVQLSLWGLCFDTPDYSIFDILVSLGIKKI